MDHIWRYTLGRVRYILGGAATIAAGVPTKHETSLLFLYLICGRIRTYLTNIYVGDQFEQAKNYSRRVVSNRMAMDVEADPL